MNDPTVPAAPPSAAPSAPAVAQARPAASGAAIAAADPRLVLDDSPSLRWIFLELRGRLPRKAFWLYGVLALLGLNVLLTVLLRVAGAPPRGTDAAVNLLLLWPAIAVSVKRWHDRDKSGWWVLVNLVPVVGWIVALVANGFLRGTPGPNRHGEDMTRHFR